MLFWRRLLLFGSNCPASSRLRSPFSLCGSGSDPNTSDARSGTHETARSGTARSVQPSRSGRSGATPGRSRGEERFQALHFAAGSRSSRQRRIADGRCWRVRIHRGAEWMRQEHAPRDDRGTDFNHRRHNRGAWPAGVGPRHGTRHRIPATSPPAMADSPAQCFAADRSAPPQENPPS